MREEKEKGIGRGNLYTPLGEEREMVCVEKEANLPARGEGRVGCLRGGRGAGWVLK